MGNGQVVHPDLGLHGKVIWLNDNKIRVEYDWTDDSQLQDWYATNGSTLVRGNGIVTIRDGVTSVRSMIWKQYIKCTRINAQNAKAINSQHAHLNFITNVSGWTGYDFNPPEIIGAIYISYGNIWTENTVQSSLPAPPITLGSLYTIDINISETTITATSSSNNITYSHNLSSPPDPDRQVAVGGWGGDTEWGKLIIEGEVDASWHAPDDMIDIISGGNSFSPVIEVSGNATIEWIFDDGTTSSSNSPVKNYGSIGARHNLLKVTPWSALTGLNLGYDGLDGGYGNFALVERQNILSIKNLSLAKNSLRYICAEYSPLPELDLNEFSRLEFIELLYCNNLASINLGTHTSLERVCVEDCNLASLNLSGCPGLKDFRGANNRYTSINWGTTGSLIWHICTRSNPQFNVNLPSLTQFPLLVELLIWDDNQTGAFECHNPYIQRIDAYDNHYTSADVSGCNNLKTLSLSGSKLTALNLGTAINLNNVQLKDCSLNQNQTDYVLQLLDLVGLANGYLDLTGNSSPSASGISNYENLKRKGWIVYIRESGSFIPVSGITVTGQNGITEINTDKGVLQMVSVVTPTDATDRSIVWSITDGNLFATIDDNGLLKALGNGTVTVRGTANDGSGIFGEIVIKITNQKVDGNSDYSELGKIIVTSIELKVLLNKDYSTWHASLYNFSGLLLRRKLVESDLLEFDISHLAKGIYLLVLSKNEMIASTHFIKL